MIHYNHNTGKYRNITLSTRAQRRHALQHYRHTQRMALLRDTLARVAIVAALMIVLAVAFIIGTN